MTDWYTADELQSCNCAERCPTESDCHITPKGIGEDHNVKKNFFLLTWKEIFTFF